MPSPSSSQQAARERLAKRLRALRGAAGLTNAELSAACGWSIAKTSRIEHAHPRQPVTESDIRAWCRACHTPEAGPDLITAAQAADELYREWARREHSIRQLQVQAFAEFAEHKLIRSYCAAVIPGFLQTGDYIRAVLSSFAALQGIYRDAEDLDQAVEARLQRRQLITGGRIRFVFLIDEAALHRRICEPAAMLAQLDHLLDALRIPTIVVGIVPLNSMVQLAFEDFYIYDSAKVSVETISAYLQIRDPAEIRLYERAFLTFSKLAVYDSQARELIERARASLG